MTRPIYTEEFNEMWANYPKRAGGNPKKPAFEQYLKRLKDGYTHEEMREGTLKYLAFCEATKKVNTEYVMQAKTFYGPSENFLEDYPIPDMPQEKPSWARIPFNNDDLWPWAQTHGYPGPGSLTYDRYRSLLQREVEKRLTQRQG